MFWWLMPFDTHLLLLLQPSVLWLSIYSLNNDAKPPPKWILREFDVSRIRPRLGGLPHLERLHGKIWPLLRGLPGLENRATCLGGSPHLSCKRDQIKMRDRRVTPPKRVTSPTWGPPPPCKQTLSHKDFKIQGRVRKRERQKTIGFISKTTTLHVHHALLYISLPVFARLRRENA